MRLRRRRPPQWLTFESNKAIGETIAISITRIAGAPDAAWRVVDGGQIYEYAGDALSHVVQVGPCKIECRVAPKYLSYIDFHVASITEIENISRCVSLNSGIYGGGNPSLVMDLDVLPVVITYLAVGGNAPCIGSLNRFVGMRECYCDNQYATQARVNAIIQDIYDHKDNFTYANPTLNIDGNNAAPSGNVIEPEEGTDWHLDGEIWIPLTAGAMVFDLVNDVNSEGFNFWNITVS
jgi:hypothetical protein